VRIERKKLPPVLVFKKTAEMIITSLSVTEKLGCVNRFFQLCIWGEFKATKLMEVLKRSLLF
jgi:hypothetical protein